jgi:hypothetical protein
MKRLTAIQLVSLLAGACTHEPTAPALKPTRPGLEAAITLVQCPANGHLLLPDQCDGSLGPSWPFFGLPDDGLTSAPNDPSPTAPGIWLGDTVTATTCFADRNPQVLQSGTLGNDLDKDWLADNCEVDLAYAFAPRMVFDFGEPCPFGEPRWAAKYFPYSGVVRIAYLPAYWDDCGDEIAGFIGNSHSGDSEYIMFEVTFNASTRHWVFQQMWLSAHYGDLTDHSAWVPSASAEFFYRTGSRPNVWVSLQKHANYNSHAACSYWVVINSIGSTEVCGDPNGAPGIQPIRFPVTASRNLGSRFVGTQCVASEVSSRSGNGRTECFYVLRQFTVGSMTLTDPFCGWTAPSNQYGGCSTPYYNFLVSDKFENRAGDPGPGPNPPVFTATISGPSAVTTGTRATWTAQPFAGLAPYSYTWSVNETVVGSGSTLSWMMGSAGTVLELSLVMRDALGRTSTTAYAEVVSTTSSGGFQVQGW